MEGKELFESICTSADKCKDDKDKINELWQVLKTNKARLSEVEFSFACEHLGNYYEACEAKEEIADFEKKLRSS